ncbi:MAG TPA: hypothetical protein VFP91_20705 [Vicinamibacterales bacterium]|nr:hypothetical protein [Vicinamibacterales bacterium]
MKTAALSALAAALLLSVPLGGQAPKRYNPPRTPWGDPDLQGVWNDATSTPLQRPNGVKDVLTDEEAADFQASLANDLTRDRRDGGADVDVNRAYNDHWMDARRLKITADHRTSLIVDPPDGRIPPAVSLSPERQAARAARAAANTRFNAGLPDDYTDMSLPVRCIIRTDSPPYLPTIYNNDFQIVQSPGVVAIAPEMIHSARIVYTDGRPHLARGLRQWLGDSRGRWDGPTLVVETTNFRSDDGVIFQGASAATFKITERFTRVDATSINYEFTVEDPSTWTKPWTALIPWNKIDPGEQMYEYGCHEDNFDIVHFLIGARNRQKNAR